MLNFLAVISLLSSWLPAKFVALVVGVCVIYAVSVILRLISRVLDAIPFL